jgi:hypothetical protein
MQNGHLAWSPRTSIRRLFQQIQWIRNDVFMTAVMIRSAASLIFLLATMAYSVCAQQQDSVDVNKEGWKKLGDVTADFRQNNEVVVTFDQEKFRAIKFKVTDAPITFEMGTIYYSNGEVEHLLINREMSKDQETRPFGLRRPPENVSKISFRYKAMPSYRHETAHVEVFGLK